MAYGDSLVHVLALLSCILLPQAHADCCFAGECPFQVSETQFVLAKCSNCQCADELGNCGIGCGATGCGCSSCPDVACPSTRCGSCGNALGECDMSRGQGCASTALRRLLRGGSGGGSGGGNAIVRRNRTSPSPAAKIYPSIASYPLGTASGYTTPRKPFNGYAYNSSTTAFIRPGFTPVGFPNQGLPAGFTGSNPLVYKNPLYRTPSASGRLSANGTLELYYWLGLGSWIAQASEVSSLQSLSDADLALLMGNGTQSCQKVILWRYQVDRLINEQQIGVYFNCIDKDGDGYIDPWEFCIEYGCYGDPGNRFANFDAALQTVDVIDQDDDGFISPPEFDPKLKEGPVSSSSVGGK